MKNRKPQLRPPLLPRQAGAGWPALLRKACGLVFLFIALGFPAVGQTVNSYDELLDRRFPAKPEASSTTRPDPDKMTAEQWRVYDLEHAIKSEAQNTAQGQPVDVPSPVNHNFLALLTAVLVAVAAGLWKLHGVFNRWYRSQSETDKRWQNLLKEDPSLQAFFTVLRDGLNVSPKDNPSEALDSLNSIRPQTNPNPASGPLQEFFATATGQVASLRTLFSEISRADDAAARQSILLEFHRQVSGLKDLAQPPEVRPFWLTTCALAGLLKQLTDDASEVTPSVLRTVAGAVDLLEALCVGGLNPNLATAPPVRFLVVDDDAVSRLAISFALKKVFNEPDLAADGEAALGLIARQNYDVIFLDVEMPNMDGYELCTKIRQTVGQRTTPVVFVTRHSDFNSRAKSIVSGGQDLIGKPFLAFEITVKALTLALRGRLQNGAIESRSASATASDGTSPALPVVASAAKSAATQPATVSAPSGEEHHARTEAQVCRQSGSLTATSPLPNSNRVPALVKVSETDASDAFLFHAPVFEQLRNHLQAAQRAAEPVELQKLLGELFLGVRSLGLKAEQAELRSVSRLSATLEAMLKKVLERPELCNQSILHAAEAALEVLEQLCGRADANAGLARSPARILVVDDDPVARRAVSGAIQLVFGRPDNADSGEAALALATEKSFDLIFLDVLMPGIDGFITCSRIHQTTPNRHTPVVFVTGHSGQDSSAQAAAVGGAGFIPKPVLSRQIMLTALTFILRARLNQIESPSAVKESAALALA